MTLTTHRLFLLTHTRAAYKFSKTADRSSPFWLPRSMVESITKHPAALGALTECDVTVETWVAKAKGLV